MQARNFRHEQKYLINPITSAVLLARTRAIMRPDAHSGGSYTVNNLYFDDCYDSFYYDKQHGRLERDKFRLRYYNEDMDFIRLERKHKNGNHICKDTTVITKKQYQYALCGDMENFLADGQGLLHTMAVIHRLRRLRTSAVFSYQRQAFVYDAGDVRLTFDGPLFSKAGPKRGYDPLVCGFLPCSYSPCLLEVKFTGFLPVIIKRILDGLPLSRTSMSKYCEARERGHLPHGTN